LHTDTVQAEKQSVIRELLFKRFDGDLGAINTKHNNEKFMAGKEFVDSLIQDIVTPGVERLMGSPFFVELRRGTLSTRRLQGWSLQHYLHNKALLKGFALCMVKNAHIPELYDYFSYQFNEEQTHPDLAKRFGLALGLKEEDFAHASQIFECFAHTSKTIRGMMLGSPAENRVSGLVDETMVQNYSCEFEISMRKHYKLDESALQFFLVHKAVDEDHIQMAADIIARHTSSASMEQRVREMAEYAVRFKLGKFEGIYRHYA
jgi:pyrroloquinoline quinone (PQQ) biosynthesis protein C